MRILQWLGPKAVAGAALFLLHYPFWFLSIGSIIVAPVVVGVIAVVISIRMSIEASLLVSLASPVARSRLSLILPLLIVSMMEGLF
jgi:hypothetical protein